MLSSVTLIFFKENLEVKQDEENKGKPPTHLITQTCKQFIFQGCKSKRISSILMTVRRQAQNATFVTNHHFFLFHYILQFHLYPRCLHQILKIKQRARCFIANSKVAIKRSAWHLMYKANNISKLIARCRLDSEKTKDPRRK